jgi:predicted TIM-barrel enzyme
MNYVMIATFFLRNNFYVCLGRNGPIRRPEDQQFIVSRTKRTRRTKCQSIALFPFKLKIENYLPLGNE